MGKLQQRKTAVGLAIAALFASTSAIGQPAGAQAIHGTATLSQQGGNLVVTTTNGAGTGHSAINWQSFSIPSGTVTRFVQPSAASLSINRVVGGTSSLIDGTLTSNGKLVLVNPAGIAFGMGAVVDTAGFTASTLSMTDADAINGVLRFSNGGNAQGIQVEGRILAREGDVFLIAPTVQVKEGAVIQGPNGATVLAAGQSVQITGRGLEGIVMEVQAPTDEAVNLGRMQAGAVGMFAGTLRHSGDIRAVSATSEGGKVVLRATGAATVTGAVTAMQGARGGQIDVFGDQVTIGGSALLDASGAQGGGSIRVGGDYQGGNPDVPNATNTSFGADAQLRADATELGDGGRIIVWADDTTRSAGRISARGGDAGGSGGFVEVSGKHRLAFTSSVDTRAPLGRTGMLLLDPDNITVSNAGADPGSSLDNVTGDVAISPATLYALNTDLTLSASNNVTFDNVTLDFFDGVSSLLRNVSVTAGNGIGLTNSLIQTNGGALTLTAGANILLAGSSVDAGTGTVTMNAAGGGSFIGGAAGTVEFVSSGSSSSVLGGTIAITGSGGTTGINIQSGTVISGSSVTLDGLSLNPGGATGVEVGLAATVSSTGALTLRGRGTTGLRIGGAVSSTGGQQVLLEATSFDIIDDALLQSGGDLWIRPLDAIAALTIGGVSGDLANTELNTVRAANLVIGDPATTGSIQVVGTLILASSKVPSLTLRTSGSVDDNAATPSLTGIVVDALDVQSGGTVLLARGDHDVGRLSGTSGANLDFTYRDVTDFQLGTITAGQSLDLESVTGSITQAVGGTGITASALLVRNAVNANLSSALNTFNVLRGVNVSGNFTLATTGNLSLGDPLGVGGTLHAGGALSLHAGGSLNGSFAGFTPDMEGQSISLRASGPSGSGNLTVVNNLTATGAISLVSDNGNIIVGSQFGGALSLAGSSLSMTAAPSGSVELRTVSGGAATFLNLNVPSVTTSAPWQVSGTGTLTMVGPASISQLTLAGGTITGNADLDVTTSFSSTGGLLAGDGLLTLSGASTLSGNLNLVRNLTNQGTLTNSGVVTNSTTFVNNGTFTNTGSLVNNAVMTNTGTFELASGSAVSGTGAWSNAGTLLKSGTGDATVAQGNAFSNSAPATIQVDGGNLIFDTGTFTNNLGAIKLASGTSLATSDSDFASSGTISGSGTLDMGAGTFTNSGTLSPGTASTLGTLTLQASQVTFDEGSVLNFKLSGAASDQLAVVAPSPTVYAEQTSSPADSGVTVNVTELTPMVAQLYTLQSGATDGTRPVPALGVAPAGTQLQYGSLMLAPPPPPPPPPAPPPAPAPAPAPTALPLDPTGQTTNYLNQDPGTGGGLTTTGGEEGGGGIEDVVVDNGFMCTP